MKINAVLLSSNIENRFKCDTKNFLKIFEQQCIKIIHFDFEKPNTF